MLFCIHQLCAIGIMTVPATSFLVKAWLKLNVVSNYILNTVVGVHGHTQIQHRLLLNFILKKMLHACDPGINEPCNVKCMTKVTYFYCLKTKILWWTGF